ncbi:hypothetical protein DERP_003082, partial [Dermatophagoides pteronyssinus]
MIKCQKQQHLMMKKLKQNQKNWKEEQINDNDQDQELNVEEVEDGDYSDNDDNFVTTAIINDNHQQKTTLLINNNNDFNYNENYYQDLYTMIKRIMEKCLLHE